MDQHFLHIKMFVKDDGFPDSTDTTSRRDFYAVMYYHYRQGSLSSIASKVCPITLGTILHRDLRFTSGTNDFSSAERLLETVTVATEQIVPKLKCLIKEDP